DAATIGNHEFDWSVDTLRARMARANDRLFAANITDSGGTARPEWAGPWTLIQRGGLKIAVIGLALRATPTNTAPRNVRGLAFGDGAAAVRRVLPRARAAADLVIGLAHEGVFCDGAPAPGPPRGHTQRHYQREIETVTGRSVARIKTELRRGGEEYALGRLIADAQRNMTKTDVALVNSGGIRADLAAGTVTYGDLYQVQPFQNRLVRLFVPGKLLKAALEHAVAGDRADAHASGLEVWYDPRKRVGHRVTKVRLANGRGLDDG